MSEAPVLTAWSPLRQPVFRALWIANQVSFVGTWVHQVGAAWLMTELAPEPVMVSLVQAATGLSMFLLVVPSGAIADIVDRRRVLLAAQSWMLVVAAVLGILTVAQRTTPWVLLLCTFLLAFGAAFTAPAWQAILPELVPRRQLAAAITLQGLGVNVARAFGPAIGGVLVATLGAGAAFLLNAISFLGLIAVVARWRRPEEPQELPPEPIGRAMRAGLRYVRHTPQLTNVLVRSGLFILAGSALWALLPLIARQELGLTAAGYGVILAAFGFGAVGGAVLLTRLRQRLELDTIASLAAVLYGAALVGLGLSDGLPFVLPCAFAAGAAWLNLLANFNTAAQTALPAWVRARGMSIYLLVFFGGMAGGSVLWGALGRHLGLVEAMAAAGVAAALTALARWRFRLESAEGLNLAPSRHWPAPPIDARVEPEAGPVLVTVEYAVESSRVAEFQEAMQELRRLRRRGGAYAWGLFADLTDSTRFLESYLVASWLEHLRQHERVTDEDRAAEERVRETLVPGSERRVTHLVATRPPAS
ncbi:MAG: MFS transporter [Thermoanaerobaculia bacterium]